MWLYAHLKDKFAKKYFATILKTCVTHIKTSLKFLMSKWDNGDICIIEHGLFMKYTIHGLSRDNWFYLAALLQIHIICIWHFLPLQLKYYKKKSVLIIFS